MKTLKLFVVGMMLVFAGSAMGQISVNVHIGTPPAWGPAGYNSVKYYYLPDVEAYYDVQHSMFIYMVGNSWVHRSYLPARYKNYDLYGGYKVVMNDYHGNSPYTNFKSYKIKYAKGYRGKSQRNIGVRNDRNDRNNNQVKSHSVIKVNKTVNRNNNSRIQVKGNNQVKPNVNRQGANNSQQNNKKGQSEGKNQKDNRENGNGNRR